MPEVNLNESNLKVLIDNKDIGLFNQYKWRYYKAGHTNYVVSNIKGKSVYLHRLLMNPPKDMVVDHIDHNGLNNQRDNLRVVSKSDNQKNKSHYFKIGTPNRIERLMAL